MGQSALSASLQKIRCTTGNHLADAPACSSATQRGLSRLDRSATGNLLLLDREKYQVLLMEKNCALAGLESIFAEKALGIWGKVRTTRPVNTYFSKEGKQPPCLTRRTFVTTQHWWDTSRILGPHLGSWAQERYGLLSENPAEGHGDDKGLEHLTYDDKLRKLRPREDKAGDLKMLNIWWGNQIKEERDRLSSVNACWQDERH